MIQVNAFEQSWLCTMCIHYVDALLARSAAQRLQFDSTRLDAVSVHCKTIKMRSILVFDRVPKKS